MSIVTHSVSHYEFCLDPGQWRIVLLFRNVWQKHINYLSCHGNPTNDVKDEKEEEEQEEEEESIFDFDSDLATDSDFDLNLDLKNDTLCVFNNNNNNNNNNV